uniref:Thioredoxin domain-containing protein n=1 Tax=Chromera velia CCMP2878 TaxID=1169474 RepID=A0A0G4GAQ2_9ALVE|eukprot:Cvel_4432.t1-p1 / transcript=Cvel_4432.t1 / gene=Cvel_4432 / organism=Chromera_velia_CCMP2878 / gene_product=hypothetical protein / transcript_product=hypothetical protein / location=Cvel_scaffold193:30006-33337(-) / protein_length=511 / sequence_SO=supercontig / SO=protein_coding / is_pseudo=false
MPRSPSLDKLAYLLIFGGCMMSLLVTFFLAHEIILTDERSKVEAVLQVKRAILGGNGGMMPHGRGPSRETVSDAFLMGAVEDSEGNLVDVSEVLFPSSGHPVSVGLYFSTASCPLCRRGDPQLISWLVEEDRERAGGAELIAVVVPCDNDHSAWMQHKKSLVDGGAVGKGPVLFLRWESALVDHLKLRFGVWARAETTKLEQTLPAGETLPPRRSGVPAVVVIGPKGEELEFLSLETADDAARASRLSAWDLHARRERGGTGEGETQAGSAGGSYGVGGGPSSSSGTVGKTGGGELASSLRSGAATPDALGESPSPARQRRRLDLNPQKRAGGKGKNRRQGKGKGKGGLKAEEKQGLKEMELGSTSDVHSSSVILGSHRTENSTVLPLEREKAVVSSVTSPESPVASSLVPSPPSPTGPPLRDPLSLSLSLQDVSALPPQGRTAVPKTEDERGARSDSSASLQQSPVPMSVASLVDPSRAAPATLSSQRLMKKGGARAASINSSPKHSEVL